MNRMIAPIYTPYIYPPICRVYTPLYIPPYAFPPISDSPNEGVQFISICPYIYPIIEWGLNPCPRDEGGATHRQIGLRAPQRSVRGHPVCQHTKAGSRALTEHTDAVKADRP